WLADQADGLADGGAALGGVTAVRGSRENAGHGRDYLSGPGLATWVNATWASPWGFAASPAQRLSLRGSGCRARGHPARQAGPVVTISLWTGHLPRPILVPRCQRATLRGISARLRATRRVQRGGGPALGRIRSVTESPAPGRSPGRRAGRGAHPADRHAARCGPGAGERARLRPVGGRGDLCLPVADPAPLLGR